MATIDYDRLTLGGSAEYYVSFDNTEVGALQGQGLADCLGDKDANIVYLNGSPDRQQRDAVRRGRARGARRDDQLHGGRRAGRPGLGQRGGGRRSSSSSTPLRTARSTACSPPTTVWAARPSASSRRNGQAGKVPVTGQDATVEGLQNILAGTQCMTVYKSATQEAGALAERPSRWSTARRPRPPARPRTPRVAATCRRSCSSRRSITKDNVKDVIDDGGQKAEDVCTGEFADLCTEAGIS